MIPILLVGRANQRAVRAKLFDVWCHNVCNQVGASLIISMPVLSEHEIDLGAMQDPHIGLVHRSQSGFQD